MVLTGFTACNIDDDGYNTYYPEDVAYGVLVNASPNSGDLYVYANNNLVNDDALQYTDARGYYNFYTGDRRFYLKDESGEVLDSLDVSLSMGDAFSIFAANTFDEISLELYSDEVDYPGSNYTNLRIINLSPDAPPVDVYMGDELLAEDVDFKTATSFIKVGKGTYSFRFVDSATEGVLYETEEMQLYGGHTYTIYTKGYITLPAGSNDVFSTEEILHF